MRQVVVFSTAVVGIVLLWLLAGCEGLFGELPGERAFDEAAVIGVAAGESHTCAIVVDGGTYCWGAGDRGQLGNGRTDNSAIPTAAIGLDSAVLVNAGEDHNCGILEGGEARCWGAGGQGQTGNPDLGFPWNQDVPLGVESLPATTLVSAGKYFSCALLEDQRAMCWGRSEEGQLGHGDDDLLEDLDEGSQAIPVEVSGLQGVIDLDAGGAEWVWANIHGHACAIVDDGSVWCWGRGDYGQLGDGREESSSTPVEVIGLPGEAVSVCAGGNHSCAAIEGGEVYCWGGSQGGKLGHGTEGSLGGREGEPQAVLNMNSASRVECGRDFTCVLLEDQTVQCWGNNNEGQLGDGSGFDNRAYPGDVFGLSNIVDLSTGVGHSCAITEVGKLYCWGRGGDLQLGNRNEANQNRPVLVDLVGL